MIEVYNWLVDHGHINPPWKEIHVDEDSLYAEDPLENTFISIFYKSYGVAIFVGCLRPKISVGGDYSIDPDCWSVINFLEDNLEEMYDKLMRKAVESV